jgi:hypothetical protein
MAQRLEAAGALGVVFQEITVHLDGVEQDFRDRLEAAGGREARILGVISGFHRLAAS